MLPDFRFLVTSVVLATSVLIFGLGAAALLRATHEEFASVPALRALRTPQSPVIAEAAPPPTIALLKVESPAADPEPPVAQEARQESGAEVPHSDPLPPVMPPADQSSPTGADSKASEATEPPAAADTTIGATTIATSSTLPAPETPATANATAAAPSQALVAAPPAISSPTPPAAAAPTTSTPAAALPPVSIQPKAAARRKTVRHVRTRSHKQKLAAIRRRRLALHRLLHRRPPPPPPPVQNTFFQLFDPNPQNQLAPQNPINQTGAVTLPVTSPRS